MIGLIATTCIIAIAFVFAGGAWHVAHPLLGFPFAAVGIGWLGIVYTYLTTVQLGGGHDFQTGAQETGQPNRAQERDQR